MAGRPKGTPKSLGSGRSKGTPNRATRAAKDVLSATFDGIGGVDAMVAWAKKEPTAFYRLWARLIPLESRVETVNDAPRPKVVLYLPDNGRNPAMTAKAVPESSLPKRQISAVQSIPHG